MLLPGESIHPFNRRIKRKLIETLRSEKGSMQGTRGRLQMERTSLSKLYTRLKENDETKPRILPYTTIARQVGANRRT